MPDKYTVVVQEDKKDLDQLGQNSYQLQVAKSVASSASGDPIYNVVFKSTVLAPNMNVEWQATYGLNWTTQMPSPGAKVTYSGNWQACNLGESFDLDASGLWVLHRDDPKADSKAVNIGNNGYSQAVNILVGVQDPTTSAWTTIWVGQSKLLQNANGQYQPLESVQIWYQEGTISETIITAQQAEIVERIMEASIPWYFHYIADPTHQPATEIGTWQNQSAPFSFKQLATFIGEAGDMVPLISIRKGVTFENLSFPGIHIQE